MRRTKLVVSALLILMALMPAQGAFGQDFGQLLEAVDKLEANLKSLVKQEAAKRSALQARVDKMSKILGQGTNSGTNGISAQQLTELQQEIKSLRSNLNRLAESVVAQRLQASSGGLAVSPELIKEVEWMKLEIQNLKSLLSAGSPRLASLDGSVSQKGGSSWSPSSRPGPKYSNLRYNDNYSYLDNPANRGNDFFDPLKRISLGTNSDLSFGGQYRFRYESDNNRKLGASTPASQEVYLNRIFLHADLQIANRFRLFTEFKYAGIENNKFAAPAIAHDRPDIENLFVDGWMVSNKAFKFGVRAGRQELQFGKQRLISPLDWANTRRTFDGLRLMSKFSGWSLDAFITRPVKVDPKELNSSDDALLFSGLYSSKKLKGNTLSGYFLVYTKNVPTDLTTGLSGDFEYLTLGTGYDGKGGRFDWSTEAAYQFGGLGGKNVSAYMLALSGGYLYKDHPWKPRLGLSWDVASGDSDPTDNKVGTFHQQFPLGHAYFGWADQVGRRNINSFSVQLSAKPSKTVVTKLNWFSFNLVKKRDALYNAGGKISRQDVTGASGRHVGNELDALIIFKLNRHASFHVGYLHFAPGSFIANTGTSESHNFLYMMLPVKF